MTVEEIRPTELKLSAALKARTAAKAAAVEGAVEDAEKTAVKESTKETLERLKRENAELHRQMVDKADEIATLKVKEQAGWLVDLRNTRARDIAWTIISNMPRHKWNDLKVETDNAYDRRNAGLVVEKKRSGRRS